MVSRLNGWEGAVDVVGPEVSGAMVSNEFPTFAVDRTRADIGYIDHLCRWQGLWDALVPRGSMVRRKRVAVDQLLTVPVPLPSIDEQRRVAARLDRLRHVAGTIEDDSTRVVERLNALRKALARHEGERIALGQLVEPVSRPLSVEPDVEYRLVGCRWYSEGLFERERKAGRDVAASRLYSIHAGDLVYNRLFAWKGSFGIVSYELHGSTVSGEFPTFLIDSSRILPDYLLAATTTQEFLDEVDLRSSGSTPTSRNRLKEGDFRQIEITVPPIEAQRTAVAAIERLSQVRHVCVRRDTITRALVLAALNEAFAGLN